MVPLTSLECVFCLGNFERGTGKTVVVSFHRITTKTKGPVARVMRHKELWGLKAICAYMGWRDLQAPVRALEREGFLMFRVRRGSHAKPVRYTNSKLIRVWMTSKEKG